MKLEGWWSAGTPFQISHHDGHENFEIKFSFKGLLKRRASWCVLVKDLDIILFLPLYITWEILFWPSGGSGLHRLDIQMRDYLWIWRKLSLQINVPSILSRTLCMISNHIYYWTIERNMDTGISQRFLDIFPWNDGFTSLFSLWDTQSSSMSFRTGSGHWPCTMILYVGYPWHIEWTHFSEILCCLHDNSWMSPPISFCMLQVLSFIGKLHLM